MSLQVGTIVKLKINCLNNNPGTRGYVFNECGDGCQVIFENGMYDGFGDTPEFNEVHTYLEVIGKSSLPYTFTHVIQLGKDFENGYFSYAFRAGEATTALSVGSEKATQEISPARVRTIFLNLSNDEPPAGHFLRSFAATLIAADGENFYLLLPVAKELIRKYNL